MRLDLGYSRWILVPLSLAGCTMEPSSEGKVESALSGRGRCATPEPSSADAAAADVLAESSAATARAGRFAVRVPVYAHVVTDESGEGEVSALIPAQIDVLNGAFASAGFRFELVSTDVVANDAWYFAAPSSPEELEMKRALRRGGANALNLYTSSNDGSALGWASFPWTRDDGPDAAILDGVVLYWDTLPGGGLVIDGIDEEPDGVINYAGGDAGTHEVGHWLGLYHTFENGCEHPGDRVLDTAAEAEPQFYCVERDSCTGRRSAGTDPIHNFMDYTDDDCLTSFTTFQRLRMRVLFPFFRR
jgi:hypothetical protein